jgi:hypothetical protein
MSITQALLISAFTLTAFAQNPPAAAQRTDSGTHTFTGNLLDAARTNCGAEVERAGAPGTCPVSMRTSNFGLMMPEGKFVKFDEGGNTKAVDALRKSRKGSKIVFDYWRIGKTSRLVKARVTGTLTSDTLNVDSITVE